MAVPETLHEVELRLNALADALSEQVMDPNPKVGRAVALARTNAEQARLWVEEALRLLGTGA